MVEKVKEAKRTRRGFIQIILDRMDESAKGVNEKDYQHIRYQVKSLLISLNDLIKKSKSKGLSKAKINRLSKFSKEELKEYLKTIK